MPNKLANQDAFEEKDDEESARCNMWSVITDPILLQVFLNLEANDVLRAVQVREPIWPLD